MNVILLNGKNLVGDYFRDKLKTYGANVSYIEISDVLENEKFIMKTDATDVIIHISYHDILEHSFAYGTTYLEHFSKAVSIIKNLPSPPQLFLTTSFVAIYQDKAIYNEYDIAYKNDYFANLAIAIEDTMSGLKEHHIRSVVLRLPLIIDQEACFNKLLCWYRYKFYTKVIHPNNFLAWVSGYDLIRAFDFIINNDELEGVFNVTSPIITNGRELIEIIKQYHGKSFIKMPAWLTKSLLKNHRYLLQDIKVQPKRLLEAGFKFEEAKISVLFKRLYGMI